MFTTGRDESPLTRSFKPVSNVVQQEEIRSGYCCGFCGLHGCRRGSRILFDRLGHSNAHLARVEITLGSIPDLLRRHFSYFIDILLVEIRIPCFHVRRSKGRCQAGSGPFAENASRNNGLLGFIEFFKWDEVALEIIDLLLY
jgi:hypothetical protein